MSTPIVEQIALDIMSALENITTANSYEFDCTVYRRTPFQDSYGDLDLVLYQGDARRNDDSAHGRLTWFQEFNVDCWSMQDEVDEAVTPSDERLNKLASDVIKALMADPQRNSLAIDTTIRELRLFANSGDAAEGVTVVFDVHYRTQETNPYSL